MPRDFAATNTWLRDTISEKPGKEHQVQCLATDILSYESRSACLAPFYPHPYLPLAQLRLISHRIGRPYPTCAARFGSPCRIRICVSRPTSSCSPPIVCWSRSFSIVSCSTLACSSFSHAFLRCRHFNAAIARSAHFTSCWFPTHPACCAPKSSSAYLPPSPACPSSIRSSRPRRRCRHRPLPRIPARSTRPFSSLRC